MAKEIKAETKEQVIDTAGMNPALLAALQAAMAKDGGASLLKSVESVKKNEMATKVADKAYRATAKFMKETYPKLYEDAYAWNKEIARLEVEAGK